jgi:lipopolysaccharide export LptBFGC system permease protein LptF
MNPLLSLIIGMILCVVDILLYAMVHNYSFILSIIISLVAAAFILYGIIIFKKNTRK